MKRRCSFFLAISACLILTGCFFSRSRAPQEIQDASARTAIYRHTVIKPNVAKVIDDLLQKVQDRWEAENELVYQEEIRKLKVDLEDKVKQAPDKETVAKLYSEYEVSVEKLNVQKKNASNFNAQKLKEYRATNLDALIEQFDRCEKVDVALQRYFMGLKPGPFDGFLIGDPVQDKNYDVPPNVVKLSGVSVRTD